ncbi:plastocyanin/azurin family copper-binding protein [Halobacteriovorax sp. YZS-1-1]|uniref:plastocyanin/azurin family copper-binding protein n=1 Tax=unclassified Halobacteriovorax TaxID=2639665 RepID=UPI00399B67B0
MFFEPSYLQINKGDTVTFKPMESFAHQPQSIFSPDGERKWQAEKGKSITVKFEKEGIHIYNCKFHFVMGMAGVIQVGKATNYAQAKNFIKTYQSKVAMKKDRLIKSFNQVRN